MELRGDIDSSADRSRSPLRSIGTDILIAIVLTGIVWFEFWGASLPSAPSLPTLAIAIGGGIGIALGMVYLSTHYELRTNRISDAALLLALVVTIGTGLLLFPNGLPVAVEIALLTFIWTETVVRTLITHVIPAHRLAI